MFTDSKRYLFRVFYHGLKFNGFQRQPNGNGIENYLEMAFIRSKLISSFVDNSYKSISRTDTSVSAIGNLFALSCEDIPNLTRLNANLPKNSSIIIWGYAEIPKEFIIRRPEYKIYAYYLTENEYSNVVNIDRIYDFEGQHDFSNFIKKDGAGTYIPISNIDTISIKRNINGYYIMIKGDKFGREQIRRMIGYIMDPDFIDFELKDILQNKNNLTLRPAKPESLLLVKIVFQEKIDWIGNFDLNLLKDGKNHFKPKYSLFSLFESDFQ